MILILLPYLPQQLSQFLYHITNLVSWCLLCIMAETDDNLDISYFSVGISQEKLNYLLCSVLPCV